MHEILHHLPAGSRVLDLGCDAGSFDAAACRALTIRLDREGHVPPASGFFVQADASSLPFRDRSFDVIVSNHSLEHFDDLGGVLEEIGRVIEPGGALFVAVPDADTFTDRVYRWLAKGGGHVNGFTSAANLAETLSRSSGLPHVATRTLCTSLSFLNRHNVKGRMPRRMVVFCWGRESALVTLTAVLRLLDRWLSWRTSVYGWAFYFGAIPETVDTRTWTNVCVRCGRGQPSAHLEALRRVSCRFGFLPWYECLACGAANFFTRDEDYAHLR